MIYRSPVLAYTGNKGKVPWQSFTPGNSGLDAHVNVDVFPWVPEAARKALFNDRLNAADLKAWFSFFANQQENRHNRKEWETGMIFKPTVTRKAVKAFAGL